MWAVSQSWGVASLEIELLIIVGEGFGELSGGAIVHDAESDGFEPLAEERPQEGEFFFGGEVAEDFVAFAGHVHRNLMGHGGGGSAGRAE